MMFKTTKRRCVDEINSLMERLLGAHYQPPAWELFRYHRYTSSAPGWREFHQGQGHVCAIARLLLGGRDYWAVVHPRRLMSGDLMMYIFDFRGAVGQSMWLELWEGDPRDLPDGPSAYAPGHPALPRRHRIRVPEDVAALI